MAASDCTACSRICHTVSFRAAINTSTASAACKPAQCLGSSRPHVAILSPIAHPGDQRSDRAGVADRAQRFGRCGANHVVLVLQGGQQTGHDRILGRRPFAQLPRGVCARQRLGRVQAVEGLAQVARCVRRDLDLAEPALRIPAAPASGHQQAGNKDRQSMSDHRQRTFAGWAVERNEFRSKMSDSGWIGKTACRGG
jgi:hypothetical protein